MAPAFTRPGDAANTALTVGRGGWDADDAGDVDRAYDSDGVSGVVEGVMYAMAGIWEGGIPI